MTTSVLSSKCCVCLYECVCFDMQDTDPGVCVSLLLIYASMYMQSVYTVCVCVLALVSPVLNLCAADVLYHVNSVIK